MVSQLHVNVSDAAFGSVTEEFEQRTHKLLMAGDRHVGQNVNARDGVSVVVSSKARTSSNQVRKPALGSYIGK
jgi:hypothetical protein